MKLYRDKPIKDKEKKEKHSKSKKEKKHKRADQGHQEQKGKHRSSKKQKLGCERDSEAFWESIHQDEPNANEAEQVPSWQPLAMHWTSMSKADSENQVPVYTAPEDALKRLPDRFLAFQEASWPSEIGEKCAALAAIANIITDLEQADLNHLLRSLELALLERRPSEEGADDAGPPVRPPPLFPESTLPHPPQVLPRPPPLPPPLPPPPPPVPRPLPVPQSEPVREDAVPPSQPSQQPLPKETLPSKSPHKETSPSSDSSDDSEREADPDPKAAASAAAQKKADAAAMDIVFDLCQAQKERPCHIDDSLQPENFRQFVNAVFAAATQANHWEEAWRRTGFSQELRPEASQAFLQNVLDCANASEAPQGKDPVTGAALAIAALSRGYMIKRQSVEDFFMERMDSAKPCLWQTLSWLLFHWFPRNKTAGWGWSRVGWSWSEWWKVVERLLSKAEKSSPEAAFKVLKETLVRMQEQKGCKRIFRKPPFDDLRRRNLIQKLSSLAPDLDTSTEEKAKEALAPLKFWRS